MIFSNYLMRHAAPNITTGHFDVLPGELRLKAWASRIMVTFLAVCLRHIWTTIDPGLRTVELELCTVLAIQISNWSLDLERCPIELTHDQAERLYDNGMKQLDIYICKYFYFLAGVACVSFKIYVMT